MDNVEELTYEGYIFATHDDVLLAQNEVKKIKTIEANTDMTNVALIQKLYNKCLEERVFVTPIGMQFMHNLWLIQKNAGLDPDTIKPMPLYTTFRRIKLGEEKPVKVRVTKQQKKEMTLKMKYRNAVLIAGILGFLVIAMLFITFNGATPNAINYRIAVTNEYASWEQELSEREAVVRAKERELGINY